MQMPGLCRRCLAHSMLDVWRLAGLGLVDVGGAGDTSMDHQ